MNPGVITKTPAAVLEAAQSAYLACFPSGDRTFLPRIFSWAVECFTGRYDDYLPVDVRYHDFEHTLQGTLCMARVLHGRHRSGVRPALTQRNFELGLLAMLLHDTGYLKKRDDTDGTGAKYTVVHVRRSADFAAELLAKRGFIASEIQAIQNMILCTGVNAPPAGIPFQSDLEKITGFALGTSDLLGQMAAPDYVEKLPALFDEFAEAARFSPGAKHPVTQFSTTEALRRKTPDFWEFYVLRKLEHDFGGLYQFLNDPYPSGPNDYIDRIEANMKRLREELAVVNS